VVIWRLISRPGVPTGRRTPPDADECCQVSEIWQHRFCTPVFVCRRPGFLLVFTQRRGDRAGRKETFIYEEISDHGGSE